MHRDIQIGVIGTGSIVRTMLAAIADTDGIRCVAVCSRSQQRGAVLSADFAIPQVYTKPAAMLADPAVHWVYIASPNSLHYEQAKAALLAGKHVFCEKPFTPLVSQLEELRTLARERGLYLIEAITLLFHPHFRLAQEALQELGNIRVVLALFAQYSSRYEALLAGENPNVFNPAFAGGALMDINLYNIYLTVALFGAPTSLTYHPTLFSNGVDTSGTLLLHYPDFTATCIGAKDAQGDNAVQLLGDRGSIKLSPSAGNIARLEINVRGEKPRIYETDESPWTHEIRSFVHFVNEVDPLTADQRLNTAIEVVRVLEQARGQLL